MSRVRVLVVDDSATMRAILKLELERDPNIDVIGLAADPLAARAAIKASNPDVLTLDLNMPGMDGMEFLKRLMKLRPMPVVVVSSLVASNSDAAIDALSLGAFDCFLKPGDGVGAPAYDVLRGTVRAAANASVAPSPRGDRVADRGNVFTPNGWIVAIGASTGGVDALSQILGAFPANCPPTVITQHMPRTFTGSFAERLNARCAPTVTEATNGDALKVGHVYLAPGGSTHLEVCGRDKLLCRLREGPAVSGHRPSVDVLFRSLAKLGRNALGVILTGMGNDGADGLKVLRDYGGHTLGQDAASSLVYGMPRVAWNIGAVEKQVSLSCMASEILRQCRSGK